MIRRALRSHLPPTASSCIFLAKTSCTFCVKSLPEYIWVGCLPVPSRRIRLHKKRHLMIQNSKLGFFCSVRHSPGPRTGKSQIVMKWYGIIYKFMGSYVGLAVLHRTSHVPSVTWLLCSRTDPEGDPGPGGLHGCGLPRLHRRHQRPQRDEKAGGRGPAHRGGHARTRLRHDEPPISVWVPASTARARDSGTRGAPALLDARAAVVGIPFCVVVGRSSPSGAVRSV